MCYTNSLFLSGLQTKTFNTFMLFFIRAKRVSCVIQLDLILSCTNYLYKAKSILRNQELLIPEIQRL